MRLVNKKHYIIAISQSVSIQRTGKQASFTGRFASIGGDRMRRLFLLLVLLAFVGAASATDYYVATWGDNTTEGNFTHPWQNVSYATQQAVAGDTIYLFNGTWYNEECTFANSGNATHQITLTSYNGTPTMDGIDRTERCIRADEKSYINIIGPLLIRNHSAATHFSCCEHINISNIEADGGWSGIDGTGESLIQNGYCNYTTISDCVFHDSGWNTVTFYGNREPPNGNGIPAIHFTIRNCTIYNSSKHDSIDFMGNSQYLTIEDCLFYDNPSGCVYVHDDPDHWEYVLIHNNTFNHTMSKGIPINRATNYVISNNTFMNLALRPILYNTGSNCTIKYNEFYNCTYGPRVGGASYDILFDRNYIHSDSGFYAIYYGSIATVRNPIGRMTVLIYSDSDATLEFDDRTVFTASPGSAYDTWTPVRYYPDVSNCSIEGYNDSGGGYIRYVTAYNITLRPTYAYLHDVTVDTWDEASDTYTLNVNSSQSNNPTWMNITMQNEYSSCEIYKDDILVDTKTIGTDKTLTWNYSGEFSAPHDFKFERRYGLRSSYINLTHPIIMTSSAIENNLTFSRTPDRNDNEITSFKIMVKTT